MNIFLWFEGRGSQTNGILAGFIVYSETGCKSGYTCFGHPQSRQLPGTQCDLALHVNTTDRADLQEYLQPEDVLITLNILSKVR